ncbi:MAG: helix-turn-helix domain-containing protein [Actinomycetota bacterium]|nr:helix-turn-helix domain-containing protein [Actinomycetota bacterium]
MSDKQKRGRVERYPFFPGLTRDADPQGERVYTVAQAAKATGLPKTLIREEIDAGNIPIVELPRVRGLMIRRQALNTYIQSREGEKVGDEDQEE